MRATFHILSAVVVALLAGELVAADELTYHDDVRPLLRRRCFGCHSGDEEKGGFRSDSFRELLAGNRKKGPAVIAGKPDDSPLIALVTGADRPRMPPRDQGSLSDGEVDLLRRWIESGAREGEPRAAVLEAPGAPATYDLPPVVRDVAFSPDGQRLFVAAGAEVFVHGAAAIAAALEERDGAGAAPAPLARLVGAVERVAAIDVSGDGQRLVACGGSPGRGGEVRVWDLDGFETVVVYTIAAEVFGVAFAPGGERFACGGADGSVRIVETSTGDVVAEREIHSDWILDVAWSPDGSIVISCGRDHDVKLTRAGDGEFLRTLRTFDAEVAAIAVSPVAARLLATGPPPVRWRFPELDEADATKGAPGPIQAAAWSADGERAAVAGADGSVLILDAGGDVVRRLDAGDDWLYAIGFDPAGALVVGAGHEGRVWMWRLDSGDAAGSFWPAPSTPERASAGDVPTVRTF